MSSSTAMSVHVYIYDLSKGLARQMSPMLLGKQINGIWHTAIVAFGQEFFFGSSGIESVAPKHTVLGNPDDIVSLGSTELPFDTIMEHLHELSETRFRPEKYHLLENNCNTFSSEFGQFLTGNDVPPYITNLPSEVLNTPFGQMIKPFIDGMTASPGGPQSHVITRTSPREVSSQTNHALPSNPSVPSSSAVPGTSRSSSASGSGPGQKSNSSMPQAVKCECELTREELAVLSTLESGNRSRVAEEIIEYILTAPQDWSVGTAHIRLCLDVSLDEGRPAHLRTVAMTCIQKLLISSDLAVLVRQAGSQTLFCLAISSPPTESPEPFECARLSVLSNLCQTRENTLFLLTCGEESLTGAVQEVCVQGILGNDLGVTHAAAALAFNLSLEEAFHEVLSVPLTCALVEALNSVDLPEETAFLMLNTLVQLSRNNSDIKDLLSAMDRKWIRYNSKSDRLQRCCSLLE